MSPVRDGDVSLVKQDRNFKPDSKRRKVDTRRPSGKYCGVGGVYDEECIVEIANKRAKVECLDHPGCDNGYNSECKDLISTKCGREVERFVGSRAIDGEVEEGEIVEEDIEEVEEGEIIEDAVSDYVEDVNGEGDDVEIDKPVDETGRNSNSWGMVCYNDRETNLPENKSASPRDVEGGIMKGDFNDSIEVVIGTGTEVEKDKKVHVTETNLKNQEMICYKEAETSLNSQEMVCYNAQSIKSCDYIMIDDPKKGTGHNLNGEINGSKMCSQGTKSVLRKQGKRVSDCAPTIATLSRFKAKADGSNNCPVEPKRSSVPKMNFAKRVSVLYGKGEGRDTLADKKLNNMSIVPHDGQETPIRKKVKETLNLFQQVLQKLLLGKEKVSQYTYVEAAMQVKEQGKWVNMDRRILGAVPGVEIGDKYHCRAELVIIGLHHPFAAGIDSMEVDGKKIAISIVASGRYANETEFPDVITYSGEGGNPAIKDRELKDQKLERGNLALKNSMDAETPVRVVRGYRAWKSFRAGDKKREKEATFTYDGLYVVSKYWQEKGRHGNLIYMFQLNRIKGQPKLTVNSLSSETSTISGSSANSSISRRSRKCKRILSKIGRSNPLNMPENCQTLITLGKAEVPRNPILVDDISYGKEKIAIRLVNDIDDAIPPVFNYIANMVYPHLRKSSTKTKSCQCMDGCSDSVKCSCVVKNRGKVPFNEDGAILRQKTIIYECGPSCKCPPSCNNRVSQLGIKFELEVFRTESVGWGLRSRDFIPSGSFICEYVGELLEDSQAEERSDCDDYLFNLGGNDEYTIDAGIYGNVGRFLNHSCSPNLYAQNVLYDHGDKRMPHVMLFATSDIPPLQELTFDYNYEIDSVYDANGNVKTKTCCCGAPDCSGRMY
uniref:Histone-lysine N-methyltransferase n=1 Tax=Daucus carota subsp. sativus TaxID=79200 RepID=A0A162A3T8_DAUCS